MHLLIIGALIVTISVLHYSTPTSKLPFHLLYMQSYFIPIILGAFWFGVRGGLGSALVVSALYLPHIMFQWGGFNPNNLIRFLQGNKTWWIQQDVSRNSTVNTAVNNCISNQWLCEQFLILG